MSATIEVARYFDRHAPRYDELIEAVAFQLEDAYGYLADYVAAVFPNREPLRILELGIGTGKLTKYLLQTNRAARIAGIDASAQMLEQARRNLREYPNRVSFVHGDFPGAIPEGEYDCVVSAIALSFYSIDYAALFRKVHRVLARGGIFAYAVNVAQNASPVDAALAQVLRARVELSEEQIDWMKGIRENLQLYQVPAQWHLAQLSQGGFGDVDCIYLRHKLGIFSGAKPRIGL